MKQRPGPIGLSCLTCRHRRKKCDKARPTCQRCTVGGFVCLGYDGLDKGSASPSIDKSPKDSDNESKIQVSHAAQSSCNLFPATANTSSGTATREYTFVSTPEISGVVSKSPSECLKIAPAPSPSNEVSSPDRSSRFVSFVPGSQSPWQTQASSPIDSADTSSSVVFHNPTVGFYNSFGDRSPTLNAQRPWGMSDSLHISLPHNLSPIPSNIRPVINFILSQYERLIALSYVKLSHKERSRFREYGMWEMQMPTVRAPMLLGCKIFEAVIDGTGKQKLGYYNRCITRLEQQLQSGSGSSMTTAETYGQLSGTLQITFLKLMFAVGVNAYQLLRNAAPAVIQIAFTDSSLWPSSSDFISLSLAHALASTHYELGRFILLDSIYSMIYVLPQVIEYDTSTPPLPTLLTPVEWVHGCPAELQFALVEINQHCHSLRRLGPELAWRAIEHRIKSWNPKVHSVLDTEHWKSAARLAVQESWRHTLLIYLYMAVGGLASDNAQVYASIQQVFKLVGIVKHFEVPSMDTHFLVQYVIAGACTPKENQRAKARERLLATFDLSGVWVLRGSEFVPVLDHIWHGAAADGRPIWWSDYVHSRQVMLPIAM